MAEVCIVGCGFVGFSLIECFSRKFPLIGYDISSSRIEYLKKNHPMNNVTYTSNLQDTKQCKFFSVAVPTPLKNIDNDKQMMDLSIVESALKSLHDHVNPKSVIVLESSVSVGTSDKLLKHFREKDIFCGFSPERVDPGRQTPKDWEIPKIISAIDSESLEQVKYWYSQVYEKVVPVSTMATAEMCKLYENCFRMVNIAYVNDMSDACVKHGIDPIEMINASSTKPFGFMPFFPGLGVGGKCIPVNPYYLKINCDLPVLMNAVQQTEKRPINKASQYIEKYSPKRVLAIGLGFKPGESVTVASPTFPFIETFKKNNVEVHYYDPLVEHDICQKMPQENWCSDKLEKEYDLIFICIKQVKIDYSVLEDVTSSKVIDFTKCKY
jgi:nucleotide sugar dehydrogenase